MAKTNKKSPAKAVKKTVAKAKAKPAPKAKKASAVKAKAPVKKSVPKKIEKKVVAKKLAPKKEAPKKVVLKKVALKKVVVAKKEAPVKTVKAPSVKKAAPEKEAPVKTLTKKQEAMAKPSNPQLNIFPIISQRPIAHKPAIPAVQDDRSRYNESELKEFESLIQTKLQKAKDEFKLLKDTLNRTNDEGTDATSGGNTKVLEDGAETAEKENLSQLAARQLKYMTNLENALIRIKNGTYGICTVTGKLISKERLIAVPHTTQSIEAKMMKQD